MVSPLEKNLLKSYENNYDSNILKSTETWDFIQTLQCSATTNNSLVGKISICAPLLHEIMLDHSVSSLSDFAIQVASLYELDRLSIQKVHFHSVEIPKHLYNPKLISETGAAIHTVHVYLMYIGLETFWTNPTPNEHIFRLTITELIRQHCFREFAVKTRNPIWVLFANWELFAGSKW